LKARRKGIADPRRIAEAAKPVKRPCDVGQLDSGKQCRHSDSETFEEQRGRDDRVIDINIRGVFIGPMRLKHMKSGGRLS